MTAALSDDRITKRLGAPGNGLLPGRLAPPLGIADNVCIYAGALVGVDSSGYARPMRQGTTSDVCLGVAPKRYDNTGSGHAAGALVPELEGGTFLFDNDADGPVLSTTAPGTTLYATCDHSVSLTSTSRSKAGTLVCLDAVTGQVAVFVGNGTAF